MTGSLVAFGVAGDAPVGRGRDRINGMNKTNTRACTQKKPRAFEMFMTLLAGQSIMCVCGAYRIQFEGGRSPRRMEDLVLIKMSPTR